MILEALWTNIVLRPIMASNVTASGIAMPDKYRDQFEDGAEVISIGPDVDGLAVGDIVVRPDPPRYEVTDDDTGEILWIADQHDILAKIAAE